MREIRISYNILTGKAERKRPLQHRCDSNIKMDE
jgi:hypothetical protein